MLELIYANGPKRGQTLPIVDRSVTFGRSDAHCQVALAWDASVSSRHFEITREGDLFSIVDLGSRNGTRVNGRVIDRATLSNMDRIEVGSTLLVVRCAPEPPVPAAIPLPPQPSRAVSSSPIEDSSWKLRGNNPIEGSFADFQPVAMHDEKSESEPRSDMLLEDRLSEDRPPEDIWERSASFRSPVNSLSIESRAAAALPDTEPLEDRAAMGSHAPMSQPVAVPVQPIAANQPRVPQVIRQVRVKVQEGYGLVQQRLYWIGPGELLTIGRGAACDCSLPHDGRLSPQHLVIQSTDQRCTVTDLRSDDGTWVNGERIQESPLFHGDILWAGAAVFLIEIETLAGPLYRHDDESQQAAGSGAATGAASLERASDSQPKAAPHLHSASAIFEARNLAARDRAAQLRARGEDAGGEVKVTEQLLADDVYALVGEFNDALSPAELLKRLMELGSLYLLVDMSRITLPFPESCDCNSSKLFHWLPDVAASRTPNLFKTSELLDPASYWEESLGCDAVVGLLSALPKPKLLDTLRELLRDPGGNGKTTRGIVGFCWPSSLRAIMDQGTFGFSNKLFESVHCIVTEHGSANKWRLCVREQVIGQRLIQRWSKSGLRLTPST